MIGQVMHTHQDWEASLVAQQERERELEGRHHSRQLMRMMCWMMPLVARASISALVPTYLTIAKD